MSPSPALWFFSLIFTLVGAVFGTVGYREVRKTGQLLRKGVTAQGVVTRLEPMQLEGQSEASITIRSTGTTVYCPVIAWSTADSRPMETTSRLGRPRDRTLRVGSRVEVRYDPADPSRWTLPAEGNGLGRAFVAMGALFVVLGLGFLAGVLYVQVL
ncbi:DUF3592 domain-containing protein [Streptomyces sp. BR123]|uniref:DUF3592 domain-containing protein n=1 Tax=Streptomyces sp. BR123 TaxID=2749828 RepID=UPI0015C48098|nr:DUF3592 domain-containing protein [Streptomyces sp. BR123]NXY99537.1 DUF3592 domain-containing protein [Streptomyces sp. BR123]